MLTSLCTCCFCPTWSNLVAILGFYHRQKKRKEIRDYFLNAIVKQFLLVYLNVCVKLSSGLFGPLGHMLAKEEMKKKAIEPHKKHNESKIKQIVKKVWGEWKEVFETRVSKKWLLNLDAQVRWSLAAATTHDSCIASLLIKHDSIMMMKFLMSQCLHLNSTHKLKTLLIQKLNPRPNLMIKNFTFLSLYSHYNRHLRHGSVLNVIKSRSSADDDRTVLWRED